VYYGSRTALKVLCDIAIQHPRPKVRYHVQSASFLSNVERAQQACAEGKAADCPHRLKKSPLARDKRGARSGHTREEWPFVSHLTKIEKTRVALRTGMRPGGGDRGERQQSRLYCGRDQIALGLVPATQPCASFFGVTVAPMSRSIPNRAGIMPAGAAGKEYRV
jgi:hypothetical protein